MADELNRAVDRTTADNINAIINCFVDQLRPLKIFLFGSFANGSYNEDSDYDFYIVVNDNEDPANARKMARKAIRAVQNRPVDIIVRTNSRFQKYGSSADTTFIEGEIIKKGMLLYDNAVAQ